jgi:mono/diheme cytochrome c family protein
MRVMKIATMISGLLVLGVSALAATAGQTKAPAKTAPTAAQAKALKNYQQICQPCHGPEGDSPMPTMSLTDGEWAHGSSTKESAKTITEGVPGTAMLPNKDKLTQEEILELAKLVRSFDPSLKPEKGPGK